MSPDTKPTFTITRTFDAPRNIVWQAWSDASHLMKWWGPKGCTIAVKAHDFKPGGTFHYAMQWGVAPTLWGKFVYGAIAAPDTLEFINGFSNEQGDMTRAPFSPTWPLEVTNRVTFHADADGRTTVTLHGTPLSDDRDEIQTFHMGFTSMQQGFSGTFDQLDAYLKQIT